MSGYGGLVLRMAELTESSLPEILAELRRRDDIVMKAKGATDDFQLLDVDDAAAKLKCDNGEVYRLVRIGKIGCIKRGRRVLFLARHLEEYALKLEQKAR